MKLNKIMLKGHCFPSKKSQKTETGNEYEDNEII